MHRLVGDGEACRGSAKARHLRAGIELVTAVSSSASPLLSSANARKTHGVNETGSTWTSYQPASRFWPFQLIEGGWLLALSLILLAGAVWLIRTKAA